MSRTAPLAIGTALLIILIWWLGPQEIAVASVGLPTLVRLMRNRGHRR